MTFLTKKLIKYLLIVSVLFLILSPFWVKLVPMKYLSSLIGRTTFVDNYLCNYSINVASDSMAPLIAPGSSVGLNRCFEKKDLTVGTIVLFGKNSDLHLGVIRHVLNLDPVIYKISNERPKERLQDMIGEEIVAINKEIDTSGSKYKLDQPEESLILDPNEYLSDFYLGKIPRGFGEEMAEVERTNVFKRDTDKFCMVVVPKKELAFVDIETIDVNTQNIMTSSSNVVFNVRSKPNVNCSDFGSESGMLDLAPGTYRYRFLLNHQVLADMQFEVK